MGKVVNFQKYKAQKKKTWAHENKFLLTQHVREYLSTTMPMSFLEATHTFQHLKFANFQDSWDYTDLRECIEDAMAISVSEDLYSRLSKEKWFDTYLISAQDLVELCLSEYIMNEGLSRNQ